MIDLNEAMKIVIEEKIRKIVSAFETSSSYFFSYGGGVHDGYFRVDKKTGRCSFFMPQDDFDEYESMKLIKRL